MFILDWLVVDILVVVVLLVVVSFHLMAHLLLFICWLPFLQMCSIVQFRYLDL